MAARDDVTGDAEDPRLAAARYRLERDGVLPREDEADAPRQGPRWSTAEERAAVVEQAVQQAIRRGEFDNLPGAGKPLEGLGERHDPDWWVRRKIEREQLTGLGPPALALRVEHAEFAERLDALSHERDVREYVDDFNARVRQARLQLLGGPPVVTPEHDVEAELAAWRERRAARARAAARAREQEPQPPRRWWRRR
ncbi:DUF1992 domain-containing protein [Microbacterium sp. Marseille-Q6965]|uniref:DnaJ family domain-containing protein n=1 Tax=Microbacterium sp. Marseille-Q6965 TaxID=2965072 RepID=UPI0021B7A376|nr:DUF1992 domain-containing protein [Microbacterium sp. Marseille-Q6965]